MYWMLSVDFSYLSAVYWMSSNQQHNVMITHHISHNTKTVTENTLWYLFVKLRHDKMWRIGAFYGCSLWCCNVISFHGCNFAVRKTLIRVIYFLPLRGSSEPTTVVRFLVMLWVQKKSLHLIISSTKWSFLFTFYFGITTIHVLSFF